MINLLPFKILLIIIFEHIYIHNKKKGSHSFPIVEILSKLEKLPIFDLNTNTVDEILKALHENVEMAESQWENLKNLFEAIDAYNNNKGNLTVIGSAIKNLGKQVNIDVEQLLRGWFKNSVFGSDIQIALIFNHFMSSLFGRSQNTAVSSNFINIILNNVRTTNTTRAPGTTLIRTRPTTTSTTRRTTTNS